MKCAGPVLEAPLGEIYQMKRAMESAWAGVREAASNLKAFMETLDPDTRNTHPMVVSSRCLASAAIYLRTALKTAKERGF
jgi:hypothetical protein